MEATIGLGFRVYIGIMEKKMETIIIYWGVYWAYSRE